MASPRSSQLSPALLLLLLGACKRADVEQSPDAAVPCAAGAHVFCKGDAPPNQGCPIAGTEQDARLQEIGPGSYPIGCVANFVAEVRDVGGDCKVDAICRCSPGEDGGIPTPHWSCFP